MKTSNIILLAVFASILIWIVAVFFTAKAKLKDVIETYPEKVDIIKNEVVLKMETLKLAEFHTVIVKGSGSLEIIQSSEFSFSQYEDSKNNTIAEVKNDTLFVNLKSNRNVLNANKFSKLITSDEAQVKLSDFETNSLKILSQDASYISGKRLNLKFLQLITENNSTVELKSLDTKELEAELIVKDFSTLKVSNSDDLSFNIKKDKSAKFKMN